MTVKTKIYDTTLEELNRRVELAWIRFRKKSVNFKFRMPIQKIRVDQFVWVRNLRHQRTAKLNLLRRQCSSPSNSNRQNI